MFAIQSESFIHGFILIFKFELLADRAVKGILSEPCCLDTTCFPFAELDIFLNTDGREGCSESPIESLFPILTTQ